MADAAWALGEIRRRLGRELPICVVGHSLGGRAALLIAPNAGVRSVVALAPWVYARDAPTGVDGKRILIVHGSADRVASPDRSAAVARDLDGHARVGYVTVLGAKHAMLRRHGQFSGLASDFAAATLFGHSDSTIVSRLLAGERWIEV